MQHDITFKIKLDVIKGFLPFKELQELKGFQIKAFLMFARYTQITTHYY